MFVVLTDNVAFPLIWLMWQLIILDYKLLNANECEVNNNNDLLLCHINHGWIINVKTNEVAKVCCNIYIVTQALHYHEDLI